MDVELVIVNDEDLGAALLLLYRIGEQVGSYQYQSLILTKHQQHIFILFNVWTFNQRLRNLDRLDHFINRFLLLGLYLADLVQGLVLYLLIFNNKRKCGALLPLGLNLDAIIVTKPQLLREFLALI